MVSDKSRRHVIVSGRLINTFVVLVNVYATNVDDAEFFKILFSLLSDLNTNHLKLGGDLNCCLDPTMDRSSNNPSTASRLASLVCDFLSEFGIHNIWRFCILQTGNIHFPREFIIHIL